MSSNYDFNELRQSSMTGRKVASQKERDQLIASRVTVERLREVLFTPDNRRKGMQVVVLDLLRSYQDAYRTSSLPHTKERRQDYDNKMKQIMEAEKAFHDRFVNPKPMIESSLPPNYGRSIQVSPSPIRQALLRCVTGQPEN